MGRELARRSLAQPAPRRRPAVLLRLQLHDHHESRSWINPEEETTTDPGSVEAPPHYPDTPEVRRQIANHYDNIATMDEQAGEILRQLEEDGLADNTIVFFWATTATVCRA